MSEIPNKDEAEQELGWAVDYAHGGGKIGFVPELSGSMGLIRLEKMANTDETIGSMMWVMCSTIGQIPYTFTPCIDGKEASREDPEYEKAAEWADFAQSCLGDMDHSWGDHLEEALTMAWAGFAPCEITFKKRDGENSQFNDGKWGFKGLPLRDQHTIWDWTTNEQNELVLMKQRSLDGKEAEIPVWKTLHYRMSRVLNDPYGRSMLLNAYRPYYLKQRIQESEAIGIDRELCGMPTFRMPMSEMATALKKKADGTLTDEAKAARARISKMENAVKNIRFNEVGGLTLPSDVFMDEDGKPGTVRKWDFQIIAGSGQRSIDARTAARDYDRAIARTVLMQFLHLGDRSGGSYGLSEDQSSMAIRSMRWIASKIIGEFNLKATPLLWLMNAAPKRFMPKLECGALSDESIAVLGQFLESLAQADILFFDDPALKDTVLERAGLRAARSKIRDVKSKPRPEIKPTQPSLFPSSKPPNPNGKQSRPAGK